MPVISEKQVNRMISMANISVPDKLKQNIQKFKGKDLIAYGIEFASSQCSALIKEGVKGLHFFTLNKAYSANRILDNIKEEI